MTRLRALIAVVWAVAVWAALWGDLSAANLLGGLLLGLVTVVLVPVAGSGQAHPVTVRPVATLRFVVYFLKALVVASAIVAWEVVTPGSRIAPGVLRLPLATRSRGLATLVGNAISLTPGTLTIDVRSDPLTLYVHVLHLARPEHVRAQLRELEAYARAAFDPEVRTEDVHTEEAQP
jgi:multicomponent Na+:H+ antiporter subunit E